MNKPEIVAAYAKKYNMTKVDATKESENFMNFVNDYVSIGESLLFPNFMKITVKTMPPRTARNPKTGEYFKTEEKKKVTITPMKGLKDIVNK